MDTESVMSAAEARVAELCGTINVATAGLVDVAATVIADGGWAGGGFRSVAHWLSVHAGLSLSHAHGLVALAGRVDELPATMGRFRDGRMSEDQVRPIVRHVPASHEASVAELAEKMTPTQVARVARTYHFEPDPDPADGDAEPEPQKAQFLNFGWDDDGNLRGSFRLPPDTGAIVKKALEASRQILFNERGELPADTPPEEGQVTWAKALARMADLALGSDATDRPVRDRYQAQIHLRSEDLDSLDHTELANLHLGPAITPRLAKYMTCDTSVRLILEKAGIPINEGFKYRTVPDRLRRAIEDRDRGCVHPGCHRTAFLVIHHLKHWAAKGPTETWNLVCLCEYHHRLLHEGVFSITGNPDIPGDLRFTDRFGMKIATGPKPKPPPNPPPGHWDHPTGESADYDLISFTRTPPPAPA